MNYIDELAHNIYQRAHGGGAPSKEDGNLYRLYAVLALAKGTETTNEDVHDAWSAWQAETNPEHRSLIPFKELSPAVQEMDSLYRDAIRAAAEKPRE